MICSSSIGVLVRDDEVREALQPHLPQSTLLLYVFTISCKSSVADEHISTLYESKGLEFNDVRSRPRINETVTG